MPKRRKQSASAPAQVVVAATPKRPIAWSKITNFQLTALLRIAGVDDINNLRTRAALIQAIKSNNIPRPPADEIEVFISVNDNGGYDDSDGDGDGDANNDNQGDNVDHDGNNGGNGNDNDNDTLSDGDDIPLAQRKRARVTRSQAATRSTPTHIRTATTAATTARVPAKLSSQPTTLNSLAAAIAKMSKGMDDLKHDVDSLHDVMALHVNTTSGGNGNQRRGEGKGIANNPQVFDGTPVCALIYYTLYLPFDFIPIHLEKR